MVRTLSASPEPLVGEEVMGLERFLQIWGKNLLTLGDWRVR